jgi:hypothetical protein
MVTLLFHGLREVMASKREDPFHSLMMVLSISPAAAEAQDQVGSASRSARLTGAVDRASTEF